MLPTLEKFMADHKAKQRGASSNSYVRAQGFRDLYVRMGRRYLAGKTHDCVLDIANVTASKPGNGAFTRLVDDLHARGIPIYVESVLNERFALKLPRMGFTARLDVQPPCFYLLPKETT
jgi:hypothetical protein